MYEKGYEGFEAKHYKVGFEGLAFLLKTTKLLLSSSS
jgi:hypothetical protein